MYNVRTQEVNSLVLIILEDNKKGTWFPYIL